GENLICVFKVKKPITFSNGAINRHEILNSQNSQVALPEILMFTHIQLNNYTAKIATGRLVIYPDSLKCYRLNMCSGGAGRRRLVIHPDNFAVSSVIGRICLRVEGAWRRLQT